MARLAQPQVCEIDRTFSTILIRGRWSNAISSELQICDMKMKNDDELAEYHEMRFENRKTGLENEEAKSSAQPRSSLRRSKLEILSTCSPAGSEGSI